MLLLHVLLPFPLLKIPIELISYYILTISKITSYWLTLNYLAILVMVVSLGIYIISKLSKSKKVKISISTLLVLVVILAFVSQPIIEIHFLDVGQGDSAIIQYKGYNLMIDTGGIMGVDIANRVLLPTFEYLGINKIDYLFITHPHYDHFGALGDLVEFIKIERLLFPDHELMYSTTFMTTLEKIERHPTKVIPIKKGDTLKLGNFNKKVVHPTKDFNPSQSPANNISLVTLLEYKGVSVLFTGDIETEAEKHLLSSLVPVDILKVAHHGSGSSTLEEFLDKVTPKSAIISVGNNRYGHPSREVLSRLDQRDIETYTTQSNGMITVKIYRTGGYRIKKYVR